jgi:DHA1 family multidrug resistance protein-like MFS transporter
MHHNSFPPHQVPYTLGLWGMAAVLGPSLGPVLGSFAARAKGWRWPIWELAWASGTAFVVLLFWLPETLPDTILLKRARRLRKLTGNDRLRSASEIREAEISSSQIAMEYLVRPFQLMLEPAVLFVNVYIGRE